MARSRWWTFSAFDEGNRPFVGYVLAVACGAIAFWPIAYLLWLLLAPYSPYPALAGPKYAPPALALLIVVYLVMLLFWVVIAWIVAAPPFLLVRWIARRLQFSSLSYYLCTGTVSGALILTFYAFVGWLLRAGEPDPPSLLDYALGSAGFLLGGLLGGFVFWWIGVRPRSASQPR